MSQSICPQGPWFAGLLAVDGVAGSSAFWRLSLGFHLRSALPPLPAPSACEICPLSVLLGVISQGSAFRGSGLIQSSIDPSQRFQNWKES